jgi:hypothetical protein
LLFQLPNHEHRIYNVLQHVSTVVGSMCLAFCYWRFLRNTPARSDCRCAGERSRYIFFGFSALTAFLVGAAIAYGQATSVGPGVNFYILVVRTVIYSTSVFATLIIGTAVGLAIHRFDKRQLI